MVLVKLITESTSSFEFYVKWRINMDIRWHKDRMAFETMREAHKWAYNVISNEIG